MFPTRAAASRPRRQCPARCSSPLKIPPSRYPRIRAPEPGLSAWTRLAGPLPSWEGVPQGREAGRGGSVPKYQVTKKQRGKARQLRGNLTDAERKLWHLLRSRQLSHVKFRRQVPLGPWIADFVSYEHKIVVEADGGQHVDSDHDKARDIDIAARGFAFFGSGITTS